MSKKPNFFDAAKAGDAAALKTNTTGKTTKQKLITLPIAYFEHYETLKREGKTSQLEFTRYILDAVREKLERDGAM
ncbi:TPA: hypothetical protein QH074_004305 [Enterobacter hormaechei subsp. steigerwaltii]|nr:hypothetical protein [Enterobacter hormaechei subsp. steigerwaltii]